MLTYTIIKSKETPIYMQLYNYIKNDINKGLIKANEKLPSKRNLAQHLKISIISVQNSYAQLLSEGYIYSREKSGYYVSSIDSFFKNETNFIENSIHTNTRKSNHLHTINSERDNAQNNTQINAQKNSNYITKNNCCRNEPKIAEEYEVDFLENTINMKNFPFSIWSKQMREVLNERDANLLRKMPNNGVEKLRIAIANHLYHFRGMIVMPNQIVVGAGTEYLYGLLVKLMGREMVIALEDPGYRRISQIYESENIELVHLKMDKDGLIIKNLYESNANTVHVSPSHHFPTGITMPIKRRQELLKWANEKENRFIIEDDYDSEFRFVGKSVPTLQSIDENEKVIYINTFSKTISPAIRISYMVLPPKVLLKYIQNLQIYSCTVSSFEQYTLAKFLEKGYFERHINRMRKLYRTQRDFVIKTIKTSTLGKDSKILEENSGLHFILRVNTALSDEEIISAAKTYKINISCLSQYYYDKSNAKHSMLVINYSGIDPEKIRNAIEKLSEIIL